MMHRSPLFSLLGGCLVVALSGCDGTANGVVVPGPKAKDDASTSEADPTGPDDPTDDPGTDDPTTADPCTASPTMEVVDFTATSGLMSTQVELAVTLSEPAPAAVACVSDAEPDEIFFAESTDTTETHSIRMSGLIADTAYTCTAAPTCPTMAGPAASLAYTTTRPPGDLRRLEVEEDAALGMGGSWTLAPFTINSFTSDAWLVIWGPEGRVRWWWPLPAGVGVWIEARYHLDDGKIVWGGGFHEEGRSHILDMWDGTEFAWAPPGWEDVEFHHDGKRISGGRLMTLETRRNYGDGADWDGFGIRIHDPITGSVDFDFDSQTLVEAGQLRMASGGFFDSDPYHANWMDWAETADGPEVYVSLCFSFQLAALDATTGDLAWMLGSGLGWTVLDEAGADIGEAALPRCQHGVEVDEDRTFLMYDNGHDRGQSSASEWTIDPDTLTAQRVWYWTEPGWNDLFLGDIDYLPDDRVLITQARGGGFGPSSEIVEVDRATGEVASRMAFSYGGETYRSDRYQGCDLFDSVKECDTLAARYAEVADLLTP